MTSKNVITSREIGERIKKRRRELRISQECLAELLGVSYQQVQRYENGTNRLNVENIQIIANALSVSLAYFFEAYKAPVIKAVQPSVSPWEGELLRYFRKIKNYKDKNIVIQVARLAER